MREERKTMNPTENLPQIQNNMMPSQQEFQMLQVIAKNAQDSGLYAGVGQQAKIFMVLLAARELGISPMLALNGGIWNIQGKIEISARLMNGLIRRAGHSIKVVTSTDTHCTLLGKRSDGDSFETSFTMDDANKAGLSSGNVWKKYPADMLYNRCMSRLARRLFPDVIGTAYVEGEIKESKELETAECEVKNVVIDHFAPSPSPDVTHPTKEEPKLSKEELECILTHYVNTGDDFKMNFEKYMEKQWKVTDFKDIPSRYFHATMTSITRNIELQSSNQQGNFNVNHTA
jgi:hypothetical protein